MAYQLASFPGGSSGSFMQIRSQGPFSGRATLLLFRPFETPLEGQDVEVIDASEAIVPALAEFTTVDGASFYFADGPALAPSPHILLRSVKDWLGVQSSSKAAFYSADEELVPDVEVVPETPVESGQLPPEEQQPRLEEGYDGVTGGAVRVSHSASPDNCQQIDWI